MKVCRECTSGRVSGAIECACHPGATHKHFNGRTMRWTEYLGHRHDMLRGTGSSTYCTHYCGRTGSWSDIPVTIVRAR